MTSRRGVTGWSGHADNDERLAMSDECVAMSAGHGNTGPVETMLKLHKDSPKAKTPHDAEPLAVSHESSAALAAARRSDV